jgi:hypothetical protein
MENLISTTDFNIQLFESLFADQIGDSFYVDRVVTYAKMMKQPIQKNMFVPCQSNGDIMDKPSYCEKPCSPIDFCIGGKCDIEGCYGQDSEYEEACNTVLFQGWGFFINSLSGVETGIRNEVIFEDNVIYFRDGKPAMFIEAIKNIQTPINTIEDLLKTNVKFKLTDNFKKHIKL